MGEQTNTGNMLAVLPTLHPNGHLLYVCLHDNYFLGCFTLKQNQEFNFPYYQRCIYAFLTFDDEESQTLEGVL